MKSGTNNSIARYIISTKKIALRGWGSYLTRIAQGRNTGYQTRKEADRHAAGQYNHEDRRIGLIKTADRRIERKKGGTESAFRVLEFFDALMCVWSPQTEAKPGQYGAHAE